MVGCRRRGEEKVGLGWKKERRCRGNGMRRGWWRERGRRKVRRRGVGGYVRKVYMSGGKGK